MDSIRHHSAFAQLVGESLGKGFLADEAFTLVDVGCGGGLPHGWRAFGERLRALAIDSDAAGIRALAEAETNPRVAYVAAFIDDAGGVPPRRNPWRRLAVEWWLELNGRRAPGVQSAAHKPADVPTLPLAEVIARAGLAQVDFLKIDVDGPDFGILASMRQALGDLGVAGVGVEVNFIGSAAEDEHSFHNTDRLLRAAGFDLFDLSVRRYSARALPGRSRLAYPAETPFGRVLQGDAVYFRDLCAPENAALVAGLSPARVAKQAAAMALFGLPDCAAEILVAFRERLEGLLDVSRGLNLLAAEAQPDDPSPTGYETYLAAFAAGDPYFRLGEGAPPHLRPRFERPLGQPSAAYAAGRRVAHGEATCEGEDELLITTGPGRWSFAVEFPLDRQAAGGRRTLLALEAEALEGVAGVGLLDAGRAAFHEEVRVEAGQGRQAFGLVAPAQSDALMVRNLGPEGAPARLRLRLVRVESI